MIQNAYTDIPRIYTAIAEWAACMVYFLIFHKKASGIKQYFVCAGAFIVQSAYLVLTADINTFFWIPCMLGAVGIMYVFLCMSIKLSKVSVCFICAKAFLFAEFIASLEWQMHVFFAQKGWLDSRWKQNTFMALVYIAFFSLDYYLERKKKTEEYVENISKKVCLSAVAIALISFAVSNLSFVFSNTPFTSTIQADIFTIRTLVDLCGITIMFILQSQIQELLAEKELTAIHSALKSQYEQYRNYQDSFEMVNMKYHDIKHQIAGMRAETDDQKRNAWLDEIEKELNVFNDIGHTGSAVLDGIIAAKSSYCKKHQIKITCVADGNLLQGIHVADLCTIFGNALDNAIESVLMVADEEKRLIHLCVTKQKKFIFIRIENYCESELTIGKDQMPITSKSNQKEHGYGMRSIKQAVEKYNGSMIYNLKEKWFELKILIPYKEI